jgi:hypothetical protein
MTFRMQSCSAVVISDTDRSSILRTIEREGMAHPCVIILTHPQACFHFPEAMKILNELTTFLDSNQLPFTRIDTDSGPFEGGVLIAKAGVINAKYFMVNKNMNTERKPDFVLCKGYKSRRAPSVGKERRHLGRTCHLGHRWPPQHVHHGEW